MEFFNSIAAETHETNSLFVSVHLKQSNKLISLLYRRTVPDRRVLATSLLKPCTRIHLWIHLWIHHWIHQRIPTNRLRWFYSERNPTNENRRIWELDQTFGLKFEHSPGCVRWYSKVINIMFRRAAQWIDRKRSANSSANRFDRIKFRPLKKLKQSDKLDSPRKVFN